MKTIAISEEQRAETTENHVDGHDTDGQPILWLANLIDGNEYHKYRESHAKATDEQRKYTEKKRKENQ